MLNLGFWNVRGMNRRNKQLVINKFLFDNNVGIFGLIETKIKPQNVNKAVNVFNNWSISTNTAYHPGGRIWILWQINNYDVQFIEYDPQYIHMKITQKPENVSFNWTVVYGFNDGKDRESLWNNLIRIAGSTQGPWAVAGDFNCVLNADERIGGAFSRTDAEPFLNCIHQCELIDSPAMGATYTWNNKQCPADRVYSKLDRWLINQEWQNSFPDLIAQFLPEGLFDHTPCLVSNGSQQNVKVRPFKYFNMWSRAPNFHEVVQEGWQCHNKGTKMFELVKKLKNLKPLLRGLNKSQFSDIEKNADIALTKLSQVQQELGVRPHDPDLISQECQLREEYRNLARGSQTSASRRLKLNGASEGGSNTAYFHGVLRTRRRRESGASNC
ncbi:uncharacterized protein LOC141629962 [Silene latifolia]|uniref:uncharacterized protein LOC141629962 n=1 Tax=Silene latifolia TaxID=37657 RepID=UPI003D784348